MKKKTLKSELIDSFSGKMDEIRFSPFQNTEADLMQGLNWYACNASTNDLRVWALKWAAVHQPDIAMTLEKVSPEWFPTWGALCRLHSKGFSLSEKHIQRIKDKFIELSRTKVEKEVVPSPKKEKPKAEKKPNKTLLALDMGVDTLLTGKTPQNVSIDTTDDLKEVIAAIENYQTDALNDKNKKLLKFLEETLAAVKGCSKAKKQVVHRTRKINPLKMTSKVKFLKSFEKIQGLTPLDIIGKKKVYVYDVKRRFLICYSAIAAGFAWKGTTLLNLDEDKCQSKTIRKPDSFFKELDKSISALNAEWKNIAAKPRNIVGRFNDQMILLNAS